MMFNQYLTEIKIIAAVLILLSAMFFTWKYTSEYYKGKMAESEVISQQAALKAKQDYAQLEQNAETQHDKDQALINFLRNDSGSVPIHITVPCSGNPTSQSNTDRRARIFSETLNRTLEQIRASDREDSARCDQLNIDARKLNNSLAR